MVKDYDCEILYHLGKVNNVVDALSRKASTTLMSLQVVPKPLQKKIHGPGLEIVVGQLATLTLAPTMFEKIRISQESDPSRMRY